MSWWVYYWVCNAWLVWCQSHGYLLSSRSYLWFASTELYCLLTEARMVNDLPRFVMWQGSDSASISFFGHFPDKPEFPGCHLFCFFHLFQKISALIFLQAKMPFGLVTQPTASTHWRKLKALIAAGENHSPDSSFFDELLGSWEKWCCSLYTSCVTLWRGSHWSTVSWLLSMSPHHTYMFVNVHRVGLATIIYSDNTTIRKNLYLIASLQPTNDLWPYFGHALIVNVTWPYAWWSSPLANEMSQLGTDFCIWLCYMNILSPHHT